MRNKMDDLSYLKQILSEHEFNFQEIMQLLEWSRKKKKLYKQIVVSWEELGEIYLKKNANLEKIVKVLLKVLGNELIYKNL